MSISNETRQRLRLIMQDIPKADEIIDALDTSNNGQLLINRAITTTITIPENHTLLQNNPIIEEGGEIVIEEGGELLDL